MDIEKLNSKNSGDKPQPVDPSIIDAGLALLREDGYRVLDPVRDEFHTPKFIIEYGTGQLWQVGQEFRVVPQGGMIDTLGRVLSIDGVIAANELGLDLVQADGTTTILDKLVDERVILDNQGKLPKERIDPLKNSKDCFIEYFLQKKNKPDYNNNKLLIEQKFPPHKKPEGIFVEIPGKGIRFIFNGDPLPANAMPLPTQKMDALQEMGFNDVERRQFKLINQIYFTDRPEEHFSVPMISEAGSETIGELNCSPPLRVSYLKSQHEVGHRLGDKEVTQIYPDKPFYIPNIKTNRENFKFPSFLGERKEQ